MRNWINYKDAMMADRKPPRQPKADPEVSKILGKPVLANDPRLIRLVVGWKKNYGGSVDSETPDRFLHRPECLQELRETFG